MANNKKVKTKKELHNDLKNLLCDELTAFCVLGAYHEVILDDIDEFIKSFHDPRDPINWMGNLATLAGVFLYSKFNAWRSEIGTNPSGEGVPNALFLKRLLSGVIDAKEYFTKRPAAALRVLRVLDGVYDTFDMNFFVIKSIIINSQIEAGFHDTKLNGLSGLIGFPYPDDEPNDEKEFLLQCDEEGDTFHVKGNNLSAAFNYISACHNDPDYKENYQKNTKYNRDEISLALQYMLEALDFFKHIKLEIDEANGNLIFLEKTSDGSNKTYNSHGVAKVFEGKDNNYSIFKNINDNIEFFLLERVQYSIDDEKNSAVFLTYQKFEEDKTLSVFKKDKNDFDTDEYGIEIDIKESAAEYIKKLSGYLPGTRAKSSFFRGMISTHYRYHNILAPSVADSIDDDDDGREAKIRLLEEFVKIKKNENIFKEALEPVFKSLESACICKFTDIWENNIEELCHYYIAEGNENKRIIDWDMLIARILIYEGPTDLIKTILLPEKNYIYKPKDKIRIKRICNKILSGLEIRYVDSIFEADDVAKRQIEIFKVFKIGVEHLTDLFKDDAAIIKLECKTLAESYIEAIVKTLTKIDDEDETNNRFIEKKSDKQIRNNKFAENSIYDRLEILKKYIDAGNYTEEYLKSTQRIFCQTINAFLSFYEGLFKCCKERVSYEFKKSSSILNVTQVEDCKEAIEHEFIKGVEEKAKSLFKEFNGNNVKNALIELWKFAIDEEKDKYFHAILSRSSINRYKLAQLYKFDEKNGKENIDFINPYKGQNNDKYEDAVKDGRIYIEYLYRIIMFLGGKDPNERDNIKVNDKKDRDSYSTYKEYAKKVIYPQIVTVAKHREDCDANDCLIMDHSGAFAGWHNGEVHILTEFNYPINQAYYTLPNINRAETEWWVDPFLISCYKFDEALLRAEKKDK